MRIDRQRAEKAFREYTAKYNAADEKVKLKIEHTDRVSSLCEKIAQSLSFTQEETDLAWLCGLLHDIGRFEQLKNYGTFIDADSIDHAGYGAAILFEEGKIRDYILDDTEDAFLKNVIACHSAYRVPEEFDKRTALYADILRDADKIDILKVNVEVPLEAIYNVTTKELKQEKISEAVMTAFYEEHAILRSLKKTAVDYVAGHISLVYELVYPVSLGIVLEQGYLDRLMDFQSDNPETRKQFGLIRRQMEQYIQKRKGERNGA